jgi:signal peptidase II
MRGMLGAFTIGMVGCDHVTKLAAQTTLDRTTPRPLLPGLLDLHYAENRDTAFSLLRSAHFYGKSGPLVALATAGLACVLVAWWRRRTGPVVEQVAFSLIVAGAVGNALDRAIHGYVVDFIEVHRWPIFNVADVVIVVGMGLLAIVGAQRGHVVVAGDRG